MVEWKDDPVVRFRRIESLYQAALGIPEAERPAFLDRECSDDISLRREVENLLAASSEAESFLSVPALEIEAVRRSDEAQEEPDRASRAESLIGHTIRQYEIVSLIGRGGMGDVWLAEDRHLNRPVALKLLPEEFAGDPGRVRRFEQEGRAVLALNHPNIITLYDFGHADEGYYIATEFVDGEDLRVRMSEGRRLSVTESIEIALQLCSALATAHEIGIIHRDIKPENVMVRRDGYVKLLDFGLARMSEARSDDVNISPLSLTSPGMVIGTASYMSPEQARGYRVDGRSDIFSLGAVLYEMLTGRPAFDGETASDIIASILRSEPRPLMDLLGDLTPGAALEPLQSVIDRALCKDREKRYQTVGEMAADLKNCQAASHVGELSAPIRKDSDQPDDKKRRSLKPLLVAMVLAIIAAVSAWLILSRRQPAPPAQAIVQDPPIQTIAVLPFRFIGGDRNDEYLGEGIAEDLITKLSNARQLIVRPMSAVLGYRNSNIQPEIAARELKAEAVVTGSLQRSGKRVRVNVVLNRAGETQPLWTDNFDGSLTDLFALQDAVSLRLIREMSFVLTPETKEQLLRPMTSSSDAHRLYLQARYFHNKRSPAGIQRAKQYYERAIALDKRFAHAYAYLALCLMNLYERGMGAEQAEPRQQVRMAEKAVQLNDRLAIAQAILGFIKLVYEWDHVEAGKRLQRSIELDSRLPMARQFRGVYLLSRGRASEAVEETRLAVALDPSTLHMRSQLARALYLARRYDEAVAVSYDILKVDEKFSQAWVWLGLSRSQQGRHREAVAALEKARDLDGGKIETMSALGYACALAGRASDARRIIEMFDDRKDAIFFPYYLGVIHAGLGDRPAAMEMFEKSGRIHDPAFIMRIALDPKLDPLRNDPTFKSMLQWIGL